MKEVFLESRTHYKWQSKTIDLSLLKQIFDIIRFGPTSANCQPLRIIFVKSESAKGKLKKYLAEGNIEKTLTAPITAIFAYDEKFYDHLPTLFPHVDARAWFINNFELAQNTAKLNSALQAAYFMIVARSFGLDCGPMSGYNNEICDKEFFQDTNFKSLFLCNLGYGDSSHLHKRSPRFEFEDVCKTL